MPGGAPGEGWRRQRNEQGGRRQQQAGDGAKAGHALSSRQEIVGPARTVAGVDAQERAAVLVGAAARRIELEGLATDAYWHVAFPLLAGLLVLCIDEEIAMLQRARPHHEALAVVEAI